MSGSRCPSWLLGWVLLAGTGRVLDALTLGEDAAEAMGLGLARARLMLVFGIASAVGAVDRRGGGHRLCRSGRAPHPAPFRRRSPLGTALGLGAGRGRDGAGRRSSPVRLILPDRDLKLGVVTALIGAPLFLHLIYKTRKEVA